MTFTEKAAYNLRHELLSAERDQLWSTLGWKLGRPTMPVYRRRVLLWQDASGCTTRAQLDPQAATRSRKPMARLYVDVRMLAPVAYRMIKSAGWSSVLTEHRLELTCLRSEVPSLVPFVVDWTRAHEPNGGGHVDRLEYRHKSTVWWGHDLPVLRRGYCWTQAAFDCEWPPGSPLPRRRWTR